jgi:transcriptional regulator with GAF, ATPase, and Fis domain/tetratricopeptide (TPR) repeat protein
MESGPLLKTRRFEVLRLLGAGGAGRVFLARDLYAGGHVVALKVLPIEEGGKAGLAEFLALRELSHPGLVRVHERGRLPETGEPFFTSEYLEGDDFLAAVARGGTEGLVDLAAQVFRALDAIHLRGYVHCDLKPGNLLVTTRSVVKVLDFGLAVREGTVLPEGRVRGTLPYVAPETLEGRPVDRRADLYSFGVVLFQSLTGGLPARGPDLLPVFPPEALAAVGPPFPPVLTALLSRDPGGRPPTAGRALALLSGAAGRALPLETAATRQSMLSGGAFVGRRSELDALEGEFRRSFAAEGPRDARVILVKGEAGIGKGRLVREYRDRCQQHGVDFFTATCAEGEQPAYGAAQPLFRGLLARVGPESARGRRALGSLARVLPGIAAEEDGTRGSFSEAASRWHEAITLFVRSAAQGDQGLVLAFIDAHRATREMQDLIAYLCRTFSMEEEGGPSVQIVLSLSDEAAPPAGFRTLIPDLAREGRLLVLPLARLDEEGVREFVASVVGMPEPPRRLVRFLLARTGGNPFFLEQWLRMLLEEGIIVRQDDRFRVLDLDRTGIPAGLVELLDRRVRGVGPRAGEILEVLAVCAEPMDLGILDRVVPDGAAIARELVAGSILMECEDARSVTFRHGILGRLILDRADPRRFRAWHTRIAEVISESAGEAAGRERVAHHLSLGTDRALALRHALSEARRAAREGLADRASIFFSRALARLDRADPRRPELLDALGDAHFASGRVDTAVETWREVAAEAPDPFVRSVAHRKIAEALERIGSYEEALEHAKQSLALLPPGGERETVPQLRLIGGIHRRRGAYGEAIEAIREGLRLAHGERSEETVALLNLLADVTMQMGDHRQALALHLRSLRLSRALGFDAGEAASLHNLGTLMSAWGEAERALRYYGESLRLHEQKQNLPSVALTLNNVANIQAELGNFKRAGDLFRRSLGVRLRIGDLFGVAMSFGNVGSLHRLRGQWGLALAYYERAVRHFQRIGNEYGAAFFRVHAAELLMEVGAIDRALELAMSAGQAAARSKFRRIEAAGHRLSARAARLRGDLEAAGRGLSAAREIDREIGDREGLAADFLEEAMISAERKEAREVRRAAGKSIALARRARAHAQEAEGLLLRGMFPGDDGGGADDDLMAYLRFARRSRRPEALVAGLLARARRSLRRGEGAAAAPDAEEALGLSEGIAASLPSDLAGIYRQDARRVKLMQAVEEARAALIESRSSSETWAPGAQVKAMKPEILSRLFVINKELNSETDLRRLLDLIMDTAVELTGAERGFLILVEDRRISFQVARNFRRRELDGPELQVSQSIVRQVMTTGEPVLTDNATLDPRFAKFQSVDDLKLTSILSVPFCSRGQKLGAIYLDNRAREGVFSPDDVETVTALSDQAAIAILNLRNREELSRELLVRNEELEQARQAIGDRPFKYDYSEIVGRAPRMKEVFLLLDKVIDTEVPVLIQGESGTGKELVARAIHFKGPRKAGAYVAVNCGAVPDTLLESEFFGYVRGAFTGADSDKSGLFVQAHRGTLFLDEIGDMNFDMQKKLLRVLQQGEVRPVGGKSTVRVDVRIVCATNKDLRARMLEGKFREDLYYRVNVISVLVPPLRDRREDIAALVAHFVRKSGPEMGLAAKVVDQEAMALLTAYSWPGNVRELENEVKKALALSGESITADDLSPHVQGARAGQEPELVPSRGSLKETMEATERSIIVRALEETGGNQTQAAKKLGISRVWLRKKMEKYDLLRDAPH